MTEAGGPAERGDGPPALRNPLLRWLNRYILLDELLARRKRVIPRMTALQWVWYCTVVIGGLRAATWLDDRLADWLHARTAGWPGGFLLRWAAELVLLGSLYAVFSRLLPAKAERAAIRGEWVLMWLLWVASTAAYLVIRLVFG